MKKFGYGLMFLLPSIACAISGDTEGMIMTGVFMSPLLLVLLLVKDQKNINKKKI